MIGVQDQGPGPGNSVRLGADVPLARSRNSTRSRWPVASSRCTEMMRIEQERLRGVAAMAGLANDIAVKPRRRLHRARGAKRSSATRVSPCAVRKPGQDGWSDRQPRKVVVTSQPISAIALRKLKEEFKTRLKGEEKSIRPYRSAWAPSRARARWASSNFLVVYLCRTSTTRIITAPTTRWRVITSELVTLADPP